MAKNFEVHKSTEGEKGGVDKPVDFTVKPETDKNMKEGLRKRHDVENKENAENFCLRLSGFKEEYASYNVKVGGDPYVLKFKYIEKNGERVNEQGYKSLKKDLEKDPSGINSVGGVFTLAGKDGKAIITYSLPGRIMVAPDGIKERLVNDFGGGTSEYYKKITNPVPAPENKEEQKNTEVSKTKDERETQAKEAVESARNAGGEASILSSETFTSVIVTYPQGKQLRISSTTGAVWGCEEVDEGKSISKGEKSSPSEFIKLSERDPGS